jgi:hypothetical protein
MITIGGIKRPLYVMAGLLAYVPAIHVFLAVVP